MHGDPRRRSAVLLASCTFALGALFAAPITACGDGEPDSDRVVIDNDPTSLDDQVTRTDETIDVFGPGAANALTLPVSTDFTLTLVAEVAPPRDADGQTLQATSIAFAGEHAVVSYNMAGAPHRGAIDVFTFDTQGTPQLTSRAIFADTDVNAAATTGQRVWLATATSDETFTSPAALETLTIAEDGSLTMDNHGRVDISSYAGTGVWADDETVWVTSGNGGHLHAFAAADLAPKGAAYLEDARWVDAVSDGGQDEDSRMVVVQGTPGRLAVLSPTANSTALVTEATYPFDGASIPESKSTVEVVGSHAFIAAGTAGVQVLSVDTGIKVAQIPLPARLSADVGDLLTNAVSVDGDLMFISNGGDGVYVVQNKAEWSAVTALSPAETISGGRLGFADLSSVNHITYRNGTLFVATGLGGLKIVKVSRPEPEALPAPDGYPYLSGFETPEQRAGWELTGDWGWGVDDGERLADDGAVFLDNNPTGVDQYNRRNQTATQSALFPIPDGGQPVLRLRYSQTLLAAGDRVDLQIRSADSDAWANKATFTLQHDRADFGTLELSLEAYQGTSIQVRLRQTMAKTNGPRRFIVDGLEIGERDNDAVDFPFSAGLTDWDLSGAWAATREDGGDAFISANPDHLAQPGFTTRQTATTQRFIDLPDDETPFLAFAYRGTLSEGSDKLQVQVQAGDAQGWTNLTTLTASHNRANWTAVELGLQAYAGKSIRLRFRSQFSALATTRVLDIKDVRVQAPTGPTLDFPWADDFELADGGLATWHTNGEVQIAPINEATDNNVIQTNPLGISQPSRKTKHEAWMVGFVQIPEDAAERRVIAGLWHTNTLANTDQVRVELQDASDGKWTPLQKFSAQHNRQDWTWSTWDLAPWAGHRVRLRVGLNYGRDASIRTFAVDDITIDYIDGGRRFAFPWRHGLTTLLDSGEDTDALAELGDFYLTGSWAGTDEAGGATLDANPEGAVLPNLDGRHRATMTGFVTLPAAGRTALTYAYDFASGAPGDRVRVELQDAALGKWQPLRIYSASHTHQSAWEEVDLAPWAERDIRIRFRFDTANGSETAQAFRVSDLSIANVVLPSFPFPWGTGFELEEEAGIWALSGGWAISGGHDDSAPPAGSWSLDGNPDAVSQAGWGSYQTATASGYVWLPADRVVSLGFSHDIAFAHKSDRLRIKVQTPDSAEWIQVGYLKPEHTGDGPVRLEIPLTNFVGQAVRLQVSQSFGNADGIRQLRVDDLWLDDVQLPIAAYPYTADLAADPSEWQVHGAFAIVDGALNANPQQLAQKAWATYHFATHDAFVDLGSATAPRLNISYIQAFTASNDRVRVDIQTRGSSQWTRVFTFKGAHDSDAGQVSVDLSAFVGQAVRTRFQVNWANSDGPRDFRVTSVAIEEAQ